MMSLATIDCRKLAGGRFVPAKVNVVIEKELEIVVNGRPLVTASITPGLEKEFVAGYLFGQGFIDSADQITSLDIDDHTARVRLRDMARLPSDRVSYRIVSGGGRSAFAAGARVRRIASALRVDKKDIFNAMNKLLEQASLYRETEGTHAAALFTAGGPICIAEDIGRHNTLDKIVGYALLNRIDCSGTFLVSTGRMSSEMGAKIGRAGIPITATKTAVTDKGLETGRKYGLTIIGFVRDVGTRLHTDMDVRTFTEPLMKVYTGAARVIG